MPATSMNVKTSSYTYALTFPISGVQRDRHRLDKYLIISDRGDRVVLDSHATSLRSKSYLISGHDLWLLH